MADPQLSFDRPVVAIFGPTAAGKTALALALALRAGGEVVSADSMQLYRGLPVLTAQPAPDELARVRHHLVGAWPLEHAGSLGEYAALAHEAIDDVRARRLLAIVAGGTGLYLRGALAELSLPPRVPAGLRGSFERLYDEQGAASAHATLATRDPRAAHAVHPNDRRRVVRALELHAVGASLRPASDELWSTRMRLATQLYALEWEPDVLAERIARRTERMLAAGAVEEVASLQAAGTRLSHTAEQILGLAEIREHLAGRLTRAECAAAIAARTRRYARRQAIWLRKIPQRTPLPGAAGADRNAATILSRLP